MKKIIIDSDLVNDDSIAILFALSSSAFQVEAITVVAGAVGLNQGVKNALNLLEIARRTDIPVFVGQDKPLFRPLVMGKTFHGEDGLGNLHLPQPNIQPQKKTAIRYLAELVDRSDPITIVTLGPLTNIATALLFQPEIASSIDQIVMVGGAIFGAGNYTPAVTSNCMHSEYNFFVDPEAAQIVLSKQISLVMIGMDVTEKVLLTKEICERILKTNPNDVSTFLMSTTGPYMKIHDQIIKKKGCYIADPLAIAYLLDPSCFITRDLYM
jgi:purine nucleosidase